MARSRGRLYNGLVTAAGKRHVKDMLVKLYDLPPLDEALAALARHGVAVRRPLPPEKPLLVDWVASRFPVWRAEVEIAFAHLPVGCFVAVGGAAILGFACHDVVCRNFFGPTGVAESERGRGIGRALLLAALHAQRAAGYGYAIIGGVGPEAFYTRAVGAVPIPDSTPGIYAGLLRTG